MERISELPVEKMMQITNSVSSLMHPFGALIGAFGQDDLPGFIGMLTVINSISSEILVKLIDKNEVH